MRTCTHPDHDEPKIVCGYPLPCPWHTATIRAGNEPGYPPVVEIPATSDAMKSPARERLGEVARAINPTRKTRKTRTRKKGRR